LILNEPVRNQIRFKLQKGQILIFDNARARILHGQTRFVQDDGRLLYRFLFNPKSL